MPKIFEKLEPIEHESINRGKAKWQMSIVPKNKKQIIYVNLKRLLRLEVALIA